MAFDMYEATDPEEFENWVMNGTEAVTDAGKLVDELKVMLESACFYSLLYAGQYAISCRLDEMGDMDLRWRRDMNLGRAEAVASILTMMPRGRMMVEVATLAAAEQIRGRFDRGVIRSEDYELMDFADMDIAAAETR